MRYLPDLFMAAICAAILLVSYARAEEMLRWTISIELKLGGVVVNDGQLEFEGEAHCWSYANMLRQRHKLQERPVCVLAPPFADREPS